jgi:Zn-dependent protease
MNNAIKTGLYDGFFMIPRYIKNLFNNNPKMLTLLSMLLSMACYSFLFGMIVSIGFTLSLLIHEMGHYFAAKRLNIPTTVPVFIPFLGALINFKKMPDDAAQEAYIGIAGPIAGTVAAILTYVLYIHTGYAPLLQIAFLGAFLNLFNLIPLTPLDGGRTVSAISPYIWLVGLCAVLYLAFKTHSFVLILVLLACYPTIKSVLFTKEGLSAYYKTTITTKLIYGISYVFLTSTLVMLMIICMHNPALRII